jgi:signal peptidase II
MISWPQGYGIRWRRSTRRVMHSFRNAEISGPGQIGRRPQRQSGAHEVVGEVGLCYGAAVSSASVPKYLLFAATAVLSTILDQGSKFWARDHLGAFGRRGMSIIGRKVVLVQAQNPGIAFSQLQQVPGGRIVLSLVSLAALALVVHYLRKTSNARWAMIAALGLICGGALGNVIDRLWLGSVTDFVLVDLGVWPLHPWPVFNVADAALVAGVGLMALSAARARRA